jgi:hypothetical protein
MLSANAKFVKEVVISCWTNGVGFDIPEAITVSSSPVKPNASLHNSQNIYLQIITVLAGLERIHTPYVIKARTDEYFSHFDRVLKNFDSTKLLSANIFVRDIGYRPYHISDHLFVGRTDLVRQAFRSLKAYIEMYEHGKDPHNLLNAQAPAAGLSH